MNATSAAVAPTVDGFELPKLTPAPSKLVDPPRVAESLVNFECRLTQLIQLRGSDDIHIDTWLVLGEVIGVHIDKSLLTDGVYNTGAAVPVLRGGGPADYFTVAESQRFQMRRPSS